MGLMSRVMWPRVGERVAVYEENQLVVEGLVTFANDALVSIQGANLSTKNYDTSVLAAGIEDKRIVVKKIKK